MKTLALIEPLNSGAILPKIVIGQYKTPSTTTMYLPTDITPSLTNGTIASVVGAVADLPLSKDIQIIVSSDIQSPDVTTFLAGTADLTLTLVISNTKAELIPYTWNPATSGWDKRTLLPIVNIPNTVTVVEGVAGFKALTTGVGYTTSVVVVDGKEPDTLTPYTTQVDKLTSSVYLPVPRVGSMTRPTSVVKVTGEIANVISAGTIVLIVPIGLDVINHLPPITDDMVVLTLTGSQVGVLFTVNSYIGTALTKGPTGLAYHAEIQIPYDTVTQEGIDDNYAFSDDRYSAGHNLYDIISSEQRLIPAGTTREFTLTGKRVQLAQLLLSSTSKTVVTLQIKRDGVVYELLGPMTIDSNTRILRNIRLMNGESILIKPVGAVDVSCSISILGRS